MANKKAGSILPAYDAVFVFGGVPFYFKISIPQTNSFSCFATLCLCEQLFHAKAQSRKIPNNRNSEL
jgi:hypothetical protein